jgi:hypothetical protein
MVFWELMVLLTEARPCLAQGSKREQERMALRQAGWCRRSQKVSSGTLGEVREDPQKGGGERGHFLEIPSVSSEVVIHIPCT